MTFGRLGFIVFLSMAAHLISKRAGVSNNFGKRSIYTVVNPLKNVTVVEGTSIFLTCNTSLPAPDIHWLQDGKFLSKQGSNHIITQTGELYIRNIKALHTGLYSCLAANSKTEDLSKPIYLSVQIPAEIIEGPEDRNVSYGHTITTYCVSIGDPIPRIYWVKNGALVIEEGTNRRYSGAKLLLNITATIEITCHAYNNLVDGTHRAYKTGVVLPIIYDASTITTKKPVLDLKTTTAPTVTTLSSCKDDSSSCLTITTPLTYMDVSTRKPTLFPNISNNDNRDKLAEDPLPTSSKTIRVGQDYFPPLSFILMWAGFPLLLISFTIVSWLGCRKCIVDKRSPFRCKGSNQSDTYEGVIHSTIRAGNTMAHMPGRDISQDSIRHIFVADLPINQTYYNKMCPERVNVEMSANKPSVHHAKNRSHISLSERGGTSLNILEYPRNNILYVRDLGQGAFGHVFQAKAPNLIIDPDTMGSHGREAPMVAVKMIKDGMEGDRELEEDFAREARLMSQFNHPNILRLLAMCSVGKPLCLLLEYICNGDLHHFLRKNSPVPIGGGKGVLDNDSQHRGYESSSVSPYFFDDNVVGTFEKLLASNTSCRAKRLFSQNACKDNKNKRGQRLAKCNSDKHYPVSDASSLNVYELLYIAQQIATGMLYLSSRNYIHRDLAARNCLVGPHLIIKISDFGLCRKISSSPSRGTHNKNRIGLRPRAPSLAECNNSDDSGGDYYTTLRVRRAIAIPIRWMPPEAIVWNEFSIASDVWSMGIVMWEIFTFSLQPYFWLKNNEDIIHFLRSGSRLPKPKFMPTSVYKSIVMECWKGKVSHRPSFRRIYDSLIRIESELRLTNNPNI